MFRSLLLTACFFLAATASAQVNTDLRVVHGGRFLPPGTELVVLSRPASGKLAGRIQPHFISRRAFPKDHTLLAGRDVLGPNLRSEDQYPKTQTSGELYFVYALTPDSTLYWSYSAQMDSLKFDVVDLGVMSVAPVQDAEARKIVLRNFFSPGAARVVVRMPVDTAASTPAEAAAGTPSAPATASQSTAAQSTAAQSTAAQSTAAQSAAALLPADSARTASAAELSAGPLAADSASATPAPVVAGVPDEPEATPPPEERREAALGTTGVTFSYGLLLAFGLLFLGGVAVPAFIAYLARKETIMRRNQLFALRSQTSALQARCDELGRAAEQAEQRRSEVQLEYDLLRVQYETLRQELDSLEALVKKEA